MVPIFPHYRVKIPLLHGQSFNPDFLHKLNGRLIVTKSAAKVQQIFEMCKVLAEKKAIQSENGITRR